MFERFDVHSCAAERGADSAARCPYPIRILAEKIAAFLCHVLPSIVGFVFLGDVVQAEDDLIGFLARGIGSELEDAVIIDARKDRGGEPAGIFSFFPELAEDGVMFSGVGGGIFLQQPGALAIQLNQNIEAAKDIHDSRRGDVCFGEERFFFDIDVHGSRAVDGDFLCARRIFGVGFDMDAEGGELFVFVVFVRAASAKGDHRESEHQIDVESAPASYHSISNEIGMPNECKEL